MSGTFRNLAALVLMAALSSRASADSILFATGPPGNGLMAMASRPASPGKIEIEAADDFLIPTPAQITGATFIGLVTGPAAVINAVDVELYHIFPADSTNPPNGMVPTRTNSPSDVQFDARDSAANTLTFTTSILPSPFTALNSVLNGINPIPNQTTGGEGPVTGTEVLFTVQFATPISLPAGEHDFFIPQVQVTGGEFYWLSGPRPIVPPGTPFAPDLQAWIRNSALDPNWLRVGTDIVGGSPAPTFNGSFQLIGNAVPEPSSLVMVGTAALIGLGCAIRRRGAVAATPRRS